MKKSSAVATQSEAPSTAVAVATLTVNDIPAMLEIVKEQIKAITGKLPSTPKTDKDIPGFGKIEDLKSLDEIIKCTSSVMGKARAYKEAAEAIVPAGVKTPRFTIDGMSEVAMMDHLTVKAIEVGNKERLDKLNQTRKMLEENLSAEAKLANDLAKINALLMDSE